MPQAVAAYIKTNNFTAVDLTKRDIIALYDEDFVNKFGRKNVAMLSYSLEKVCK